MRYDALVAAVDVPGMTAIGLVEKLQSFHPSAQTERVVSRQTQVLLHAGREGHAVLHDIDVYLRGINAYVTRYSPSTPRFTRTDVYAFNALKDQFFGEGGGNEAANAQFLGALEQRLGTRQGYSVFNGPGAPGSSRAPMPPTSSWWRPGTPPPDTRCWSAARRSATSIPASPGRSTCTPWRGATSAPFPG